MAMRPMVVRLPGASQVQRKIPGVRIAVALHAHDHGLAILDHLVHVKSRHWRCCSPRGQVDPRVVKEISGYPVCPKVDRVALIPRPGVMDIEHARRAMDRRRTHQLCISGRVAHRSLVPAGAPIRVRLQARNRLCVGRNHRRRHGVTLNVPLVITLTPAMRPKTKDWTIRRLRRQSGC